MALTKFNYNSFDVTPVASKALAFNSDADGFTTATSGSMVLIKTLTASSSGTLSFVDGTDDVVLDNTYPTYLFKFIGIHPQTDDEHLMFQGNAAGGADYNETITSTLFRAYHHEGEPAAPDMGYITGDDQAQGTAFQQITHSGTIGSDNDENASGELWLFNPSSTTFVKHFTSRISASNSLPAVIDTFCAGYFNTTSAIDEIQFKMSSGNIDAGDIKLYGIKDS